MYSVKKRDRHTYTMTRERPYEVLLFDNKRSKYYEIPLKLN
jgi:hypothetical protein